MLFLVSVLSGIIGGMGIGGGVILIPVLTAFFDITQKNAQFINLIYFVPLSLCALFVHIKEGRVDIRRAILMALGGILGALAGCTVTARMDVVVLKKLFGVFLFFVGIGRFRKKENENG